MALGRKQRAFLTAFAKTGNITLASSAAGVGRRDHYDWIRKPEYSAAFAEAEDEACELMEGEALRRAVQGTLRAVYYQGAEVGKVREYSDVLLMFLLKGRKPQKYRDNVAVQHSGELSVITERLVAARRRLKAA